MSDGDGLVGEVRVGADDAVSVRFKYAFKWLGKVAWYQCGTWPTVDMAEIRERRDKARESVRAGINPTDGKKAERIEAQAQVEAVIAEAERRKAEDATVADLFDVWIMDGVRRKDGGAELRRSFGKDVLPAIGQKPVRLVTEADVRSLLRAVVKRGRNRLAVLILADLTQMFRWAEKRQPWRRLLAEGNPAALVAPDTIVGADYEGNERERTLSPAELRELRDKLAADRQRYEGESNKRSAARPLSRATEAALWVILSTTCRVGEVSRAAWADVDLEAGEWLIPAKNSKNAKPHMVFLSDFAKAQFRVLKELAGDSRWVMPGRSNDEDVYINPKAIGKQLADRQAALADRKPLKGRSPQTEALVLSGGRWASHDLRRTGATMMVRAGVLPLIADRCLNHIEANVLRRVYLVYDYADEKREAWRLLGERLEAILAENVVMLPERGVA